MIVEIAKSVVDFNKSLNDEDRLKEIIREIHNVCISDIHFQNDQLSDILSELEQSKEAIKSKKIVLNESIKAVAELKKRNKNMMLFIDEQRDKLIQELDGDI
jgi:hypothetical protein